MPPPIRGGLPAPTTLTCVGLRVRSWPTGAFYGGRRETFIAVHDPRNFGKAELPGRYAWPECTDSWNWPVAEGSPVTVEVYTAAPEAELLLNGQSLGRKAAEHNKAAFKLPFAKGQLTAVSYDGDREVSRSAVRFGNVAPYAENELSAEVDGAALLALGSARPQTE